MSSVLYDQPGPRARRRILLSSIAAGLLLLAVLAVVARRLAANGQFEGEKWSPLFDPANEFFPRVWELLWEGIQITMQAAFFAIVASLVLGTVIAIARVSSGRVARVPIVAFVEFMRGVPVVIAIFFVWRLGISGSLGPSLDLIWYVVIGLTLYNSVVIAEIIRAGINSLPRGQTEAAYALGLTRGQTLRLVLLPQAFRVMLPALISQLVVILKDTSLGAFITLGETVRTGNLLVQTLRNPIQMYLLIGAMFVAVNYALGKLAEFTERRLSRAAKTKDADEAPEPAADKGVPLGTGYAAGD